MYQKDFNNDQTVKTQKIFERSTMTSNDDQYEVSC